MYQSKSLASKLALQLRGSSYRLHVNLAKLPARAFGTSKSPYQDHERPLDNPATIGTEEWFKSDAEDMIKQYEKVDGPEHFAARSDIESSVKDRFGGTLTEHAKEVLKEKLMSVGSRVKETVKEKVSEVTAAAKDSASNMVFGKKSEASVEEMGRDLAAQTKSAAEILADKAKAAVYQVKEVVAESETMNALKEKAEKTASNMKDKVKDMASAGMSSVQETVSEKMHQATDVAKEKIQDVMPSMDAVKAKASEVMQQAKEKGSEMASEMPSMDAVKAKASEVMQQAKEKGSEMASEMPSMGAVKSKASEVMQQAKEKGSEMASEMPSMGAVKAKASEVMQQAKEKASDMPGAEDVKGAVGTFGDAVKKAIEFEFVEPLGLKSQKDQPERIVKQPSTMNEWVGDLNLGDVRKSADHAVEKVKAAAHMAKDKLGNLAHRAEEAVERTMHSNNVAGASGAADISSSVKAKGEAAMGKLKQKGKEVKEKVKAGVSEAVPEEIPDDFNPDRIAVALKSVKKQAAEAAKGDDAFYKQEHIRKGDAAEGNWAESYRNPIFRRKFADVPGVGSFGNNVVKQSSQDKMTPSMDALGDMSSAAETSGMKKNEETFDHIRYEDLEFDDRVESLGMEPPEQNWETDMIQTSVADAEKEANSMVHDLSKKTQAARKHLRK